MDRRTALRSLAITVWGMMVLPGCSTEDGGEAPLLTKTLPLTETQKANLQSLVDTLLPKTDTLGAVDLNVHVFLDKLIANCYDEAFQHSFIGGLDALDNEARKVSNQSYADLPQLYREEVLVKMDDEKRETEKMFFDNAKELTILGYTSSEYFLTNYTNYNMVPGGYEGCVSIPDEPFKI